MIVKIEHLRDLRRDDLGVREVRAVGVGSADQENARRHRRCRVLLAEAEVVRAILSF